MPLAHPSNVCLPNPAHSNGLLCSVLMAVLASLGRFRDNASKSTAVAGSSGSEISKDTKESMAKSILFWAIFSVLPIQLNIGHGQEEGWISKNEFERGL